MASLTQQLADYLSGVATRPLPDDVQQRVKLHLLDTLGAMISGATLDAGRLAIEYVRHETRGHEASVIGGGLLTSAADAAWANGMSGHADETDDSHPSGFHPGCGIVAAALAMAERQHSSGSVLLRAIAAGDDTGGRAVLAAMPLATRARGCAVTSHAIGGTFGATAAAATQAGLDAARMSYVLVLRGAASLGRALVPARCASRRKGLRVRWPTGACRGDGNDDDPTGFDAVSDAFDGQFNYFRGRGLRG